MTIRRFASRRQQVATFAVVGTVLFVATTVGVHSLFVVVPPWMAAIVALYPTLFIGCACMAVAERWGWLRAAPTNHDRHDGDTDRTPPRWVAWTGNVIVFGLFFGFGDSWHNHWHDVYPNAPGWSLDAAILILAVLASILVEAVLVQIVERVRGNGVAARHEPHGTASDDHYTRRRRRGDRALSSASSTAQRSMQMRRYAIMESPL